MLAIIFLLNKIKKWEESLLYSLLNNFFYNTSFNDYFLIHKYHGEKFLSVIPSWN